MNISSHSQPATDGLRGERRLVRRPKDARCGVSLAIVSDLNLEFAN